MYANVVQKKIWASDSIKPQKMVLFVRLENVGQTKLYSFPINWGIIWLLAIELSSIPLSVPHVIVFNAFNH